MTDPEGREPKSPCGGRVTYEVDAGDVITGVGEDWIGFAAANGAEHLGSGVIGESLWRFVSGDVTRHVYRALMARARRGQSVAFPYRCDAPHLRRVCRMALSPAPGDGVRFESVIVEELPRPCPPLAALSRSGLLTMCGWCAQVSLGDRWEEVERAVADLQLFVQAQAAPAGVTHGICPPCARLFEDGWPHASR